MKQRVFDYKTVNFDKLVKFGFTKEGGKYVYATHILDGQFEMSVAVDEKGEVKTQVVDLSTDEPYTLHLVAEASGSFVGAVRAEYERVLTAIADNCFERDVFKGDCAHRVIEYARTEYGDELEFLWKTFPSNAVLRRKDNNKWYGVFLTLSAAKLGLDCDEMLSIIDLRIDPDVLPKILDGKKYFPAYHMNKKKWFTMCLDGSVTPDEICDWIDKSYELAKKG